MHSEMPPIPGTRARKHQVLIVGGGPVGLTLAIDLGQRGIDVLLVEKRLQASNLPKMERCHPRTMEIFARLGIAERVRAVGYPEDAAYDAFLVTSLAELPVQQIARPSVREQRARSRAQRRHPARRALPDRVAVRDRAAVARDRRRHAGCARGLRL